MATQLIGCLHKIEQLGTLVGHRDLGLEIYTPTRAVHETKFCLHRVITSWRIHINAPETLPRISCICSLSTQYGTALEYDDTPNLLFRKLDLRVLLNVAAQLPNLQGLNCNIGGDEFVKGLDVEEARYSL
ncbi:hypothetical protein E8E13_008053 [Curvularia kusanoi]|uniref:Uncharacterized protein n=1 Tax=Curvularia kusanoi TaxID=90978 RepID=A0A9P4TB78_CURKU|nr:hypothetical protein E8E13_008053 [Curvularia kusanoi]